MLGVPPTTSTSKSTAVLNTFSLAVLILHTFGNSTVFGHRFSFSLNRAETISVHTKHLGFFSIKSSRKWGLNVWNLPIRSVKLGGLEII